MAVLTSEGDVPGMNTVIRTVVRTGLDHGWGVFGIRNDCTGLISGMMESLTARDVGGILQRRGTPGMLDRILATRLGAGATESLACGGLAVLVALIKGDVITSPRAEPFGRRSPWTVTSWSPHGCWRNNT
ncbi:MAG: 6-phosphofructokinase [Candidatus Methylomirabilales bacterium]